MAVPPTNEAFLREVDDELRRDQLASFWTRYGRLLIAAILLGLAAFAGYLYWRNHQENVRGEEGEKLQAAYDALAGGRAAQAAQPLDELTRASSEGYRALALFAQGDALLARGDVRGAAAKFGEIARGDAYAQAFRDLALVRQTAAEFDALQPQVVIDRLRTLAVPGNAYFGSAGELVAAAHLRAGRRDLAGRLFGQIAREANVPESIRQRAIQMAGLLGVDAIDQSEGSRKK